MHARIYDFTLGAGGMQRLPVVGDFFKVISATGQINVIADTGAQLDLMPGQGLREFQFNTLAISDKSGAANAGKILVGFSGMIDDRVTGEVSIVEGGRSRVLAGAAFCGSSAVAAAAGLYSQGQLWNPAASGKRLIVSEVVFEGGAGGATVQMRWNQAALANLAMVGQSKLLGGAASVAEVRWDQAAGPTGTNMFGAGVDTKANQWRFAEPLIVNPGYGLILGNAGVNSYVRSNFQYFEEPV